MRRRQVVETLGVPGFAVFRGKRGFEIVATHLIALTLTLVAFGLALSFLSTFREATTAVVEGIDTASQQAALRVFQSGGTVAIPAARRDAQLGDTLTYWIGINNVYDTAKQLHVTIALTSAINVDEVELPADPTHVNPRWLLYSPGPYTVIPLNATFLQARLKVSDTIAPQTPTPEGTYTFNVCVTEGELTFDCGKPPLQLPGQVYSGRLYKLVVDVKR